MSRTQQVFQIVNNLIRRLRLRNRTALAQTRTVVVANCRKTRNLRLYAIPGLRCAMATSHQN